MNDLDIVNHTLSILDHKDVDQHPKMSYEQYVAEREKTIDAQDFFTATSEDEELQRYAHRYYHDKRKESDETKFLHMKMLTRHAVVAFIKNDYPQDKWEADHA